MIPEVIITIFVLIICFCLIRGIYETYVLKISYGSLGDKLEDNNDPGKSRGKIRVFLFSDIHTSFLNISASTVADEIDKSDADVILFAGDMVNKGTPNEVLKLQKFFKTICDAAKHINNPILYSL